MLAGFVRLSLGDQHSMIVKQDGSVWGTGANEYGQLGDGSTINRKIFMCVMPDGVTVVAAGAFHSMVIKEDDTIWASGLNHDGQFGDGSIKSKQSFVRLAPFANGAGTAQTCHKVRAISRHLILLCPQ